MLYEVITHRFDVGHGALAAGGGLEGRLGFGEGSVGLGEQSDGVVLHLFLDAGDFALEAVGIGFDLHQDLFRLVVVFEELRITSYNVCYTKLLRAPRGKGSMADIEAMKSDVAGLEEAVNEIQPLIDAGEYAAAIEKATAIKTRAVSVSDEIKAVQEKLAALKKK